MQDFLISFRAYYELLLIWTPFDQIQPRTNPGLTNDMLSRANTVLVSASSLMKIIVPDQKSSSFIEHSKVIDILPIKTHTLLDNRIKYTGVLRQTSNLSIVFENHI